MRFLTLYALGMRNVVGRRLALFGIAAAATIVMMGLAQWDYPGRAIDIRYNWFHPP